MPGGRWLRACHHRRTTRLPPRLISAERRRQFPDRRATGPPASRPGDDLATCWRPRQRVAGQSAVFPAPLFQKRGTIRVTRQPAAFPLAFPRRSVGTLTLGGGVACSCRRGEVQARARVTCPANARGRALDASTADFEYFTDIVMILLTRSIVAILWRLVKAPHDGQGSHQPACRHAAREVYGLPRWPHATDERLARAQTVDGRTAGGDKPEHPPVLAKHRASRPVTTRGGRGRTRG